MRVRQGCGRAPRRTRCSAADDVASRGLQAPLSGRCCGPRRLWRLSRLPVVERRVKGAAGLLRRRLPAVSAAQRNAHVFVRATANSSAARWASAGVSAAHARRDVRGHAACAPRRTALCVLTLRRCAFVTGERSNSSAAFAVRPPQRGATRGCALRVASVQRCCPGARHGRAATRSGVLAQFAFGVVLAASRSAARAAYRLRAGAPCSCSSSAWQRRTHGGLQRPRR